ncbi:MAG: hypothetical protein VX606_08430, partial [Pseudomonadota bacterium]|nr:hypothetical protein [Pseudomonadota bacterium]
DQGEAINIGAEVIGEGAGRRAHLSLQKVSFKKFAGFGLHSRPQGGLDLEHSTRRRAEGTVVQMREMRSQGKGRAHCSAKRGGGLELHGIYYTPESQRRHPSFDLAGPSSYNRLNKNNAGAPPNAGLWKGLGP